MNNIVTNVGHYLRIHDIILEFNQLPRLSGTLVPGIPRGYHYGQSAPR